MSKCDISIQFDREDRTYTGGERVTGTVVLHVNEDVTCKGITLTHLWKTHGRGNIDTGPKETIELAPAGPLTTGETLNLPFSLTSATHPVTYHGHLINVDHYVCVEVNVPWSFNPKAQEDYILLAGEPPAQFSGPRSAVISLAAPPQKAGLIATIIIWILVAVVVTLIAAFAICLLPAVLIVIGAVWLRRRALASRLGEVQLTIPHVVVAPAEDWRLRIQFQPRKQFRINGIFLTLIGKESAKSGSGTSATTSTHKVVEHKAVIRPGDMLEAGEPVDETFSMEFPETSAYSFEATDNKIDWTAEVRIDIPLFPDWSKTQPLQVVPMAFLTNMSDLPATATGSVSSPYAASPPAIPVAAAPFKPARNRPESRDDTDQRDATSSPDRAPQDLLELAAQIRAVNRHGNARGDIVASVLGATFDATIIVDRINSSMGLIASQPGYEGGKTVIGAIQGTDQSIQVLTPKSLNDDVDDLRRGDVWPLMICVDGWDSLYNRINARQIEESDS